MGHYDEFYEEEAAERFVQMQKAANGADNPYLYLEGEKLYHKRLQEEEAIQYYLDNREETNE